MSERTSSKTILQATELPKRDVSLDDISLHGLGISWEALKALGREINGVQRTPLDKFDVQRRFRDVVDPQQYDAIPMVASAIAHRDNPNIPVLNPNEEEVKALEPLVGVVGGVLRQISQKWATRFDRYVEARVKNILQDTAAKVHIVLDGLANIQNPRKQYTKEMAGLYRTAAEPIYYQAEAGLMDMLFGEEPGEVRMPIEDIIKRLIETMAFVRDGYDTELDSKSYPLLNWLLRTSKFPPPTLDPDTASVAGSEMMQGIEGFLRLAGVSDIPQAPPPREAFDVFDPDTWLEGDLVRGYAETFEHKRLAAVRDALPYILDGVRRVLPENGPQVRRNVQTLAENILILSQRGHTGEEIAKALIKKPRS